MNKKFAVLSISALLAVLAVPLLAQTIRLTANVPFEFVVNNRTLPAGDYSITRGASPLVVMIRNANEHAGVLSTVLPEHFNASGQSAPANLVFHRYGDKYFLSQINDGYVDAGFLVPESRTEREFEKTASIPSRETVTLLARR
jgi:hypothetical protein